MEEISHYFNKNVIIYFQNIQNILTLLYNPIDFKKTTHIYLPILYEHCKALKQENKSL